MQNLVTLVAFKWSFPSVYVRNTDTYIRVFPQRQHWHGVASACISICHLRLTTCEKDLSYILHLCSFSPVWTSWWFLRSLLCTNALSQWWHWYGLSPVWILMWLIRWLFCDKGFPHWKHWYVFSPVCIFICLVRSWLCAKALSHWLHLNGLSPVCTEYCYQNAIAMLLKNHLKYQNYSKGENLLPTCVIVSMDAFSYLVCGVTLLE